ncbi:MAG: FHA domain-containing protein, partial [Candidatus Zixiibacteriota bacterium]
KELGLAVLVIDYDDVLKRIRDYPKDKLILPGFGGGDKMKFPKGGELTALLQFGPIDKDDMCRSWKALFVEQSIPTHLGVELTGIEKRADGVWEAKTWVQKTDSERVYLARHIILGIGCGEPRRFDIPGNTEGIAYRLSDAELYVGKPACVLGGGTSAAEAVISISNTKARREDPSGVYWSCRGEKMPRVSQALATVFFEAQMGNGNIRICPNSEAFAVVTAQDHKEYLSVRSDRRFIEGRPNEASYLEFEKDACVACIGEDLPERLLNSLGISMVTGGPNNKKRMALTPLMETQQPNVYMIGDLLRPAYLETDDFNSAPETFREIKHRGNIKVALRDGVKVIEIIKQRLEGKTEISVTIEDAEDRIPTVDKALQELVAPVEAQAPPPESEAPGRSAEEAGAYLVRILPGDVMEDEYSIKSEGITTIGRKDCDISFPEDTMLSEAHASISHNEEGYFIRDDGSVSGVYLQAIEGAPLELAPGSMVRAGRQFLQFIAMNGGYGFVHLDHTGKERGRHAIGDKTLVLGREAPDITLDSADKTLSRRHVAVSVKRNRIYVKDLKSVNGSFLIVKDARRIENGQRFRVG